MLSVQVFYLAIFLWWFYHPSNPILCQPKWLVCRDSDDELLETTKNETHKIIFLAKFKINMYIFNCSQYILEHIKTLHSIGSRYSVMVWHCFNYLWKLRHHKTKTEKLLLGDYTKLTKLCETMKFTRIWH